MRSTPLLFARPLLFLFLILILGTVVVTAGSPAADTAEPQTITRQVNGRSVMQYLSPETGPSIWTDDRGYRAVDWKDRSWRANGPPEQQFDDGRLDTVWESSGPFAADINHILISHSNPNVVYAAVACGGEPFLGGVFRSTNGGQQWSRLDPDTHMGPVCNLAMNPENSNELFASAELGLFRSSNGGNSWTQVQPVSGLYGRSLRVAYNPAGGDELVAHYYCEPPPDSRLFRSTDGVTASNPSIPDCRRNCQSPISASIRWSAPGSLFPWAPTSARPVSFAPKTVEPTGRIIPTAWTICRSIPSAWNTMAASVR